MRRADSLEKTLMLGKTESRRRRGWQRIRWWDSIIDSVNMSLSKRRETMDREAWQAEVHGAAMSQIWLSDWTATTTLLLLLLSRLSRVWLCATPETAAHQAPPSLGFSRQEHWSGLPFPSPMRESEKCKSSRSVVSNSSRPHGLQPTRLLRPWDFPGKSTGVGCHCLLRTTTLFDSKVETGKWQAPGQTYLSSIFANECLVGHSQAHLCKFVLLSQGNSRVEELQLRSHSFWRLTYLLPGPCKKNKNFYQLPL